MSEKVRRIMLGFHSSVDGRLLWEWLAGLGYDVVAFLDDTDTIDLVVMDSATARRLMDKAFGLKREAKYFLPVLVCINAGEDVSRWLKAGFDDVLRLPATKDEWRARIEIMLRLRRQSEELAHRSEVLHQALVESSSDQIFMLDANGTYVASNDRVEHFGLERGDELVGKTIDQVYPEEIAPFYRTKLQWVLREEQPVVFEHDLPSTQENHYHLDTLYPVTLPDGKVMVGGICRDITERKRAAQELAASEERYRLMLNTTLDGFILADEEGKILQVNPSYCDMIGYSEQELLSMNISDIEVQQSEQEVRKNIHLMIEQGSARFETRHRAKDGHSIDLDVSVSTLMNEKKTLGVAFVRDISERKQVEADRRVLETAINNAQECIMVSDRKNRLTYVNRTFEKLTGYSAAEVLGNTLGMLKSGQHDRSFYQNLKKTIYAGDPWQGNLILRKKNGNFYEAYVTITPICDQAGIPEHFVSVHRDVTRERELEQRIQQNQRLEAIGTLAGGIAHDFNNLLSPIMGYTELCMDTLPSGSKVREDLEEVMGAARRATDLVRQILSFSRRSNHERKPLRVASVVKEALKLLRASIPVTIDIRQEISGAAEAVIADPTEIHQVVMNLCTNAFHAMPEGGVLTVSLKPIDLDSDACATIVNCTPGRYLNLSVEDTGCGIPPEIRNKIFEPYFTTKEEGRGTGLGLAVTHSIVSACGGAINVYSELGKGTRFSLYFPVAENTQAEVVEKVAITGGGQERILFVDDDAAIVALGRRTLERYGYIVTTSSDPLQALEQFKEAPTDFDMVITDMTMPGMTGDLLSDALLKIRPDLPVIVCTGFSERINKEKAQKMGVRRLLGKPVAPGTLLATIREIFDSVE